MVPTCPLCVNVRPTGHTCARCAYAWCADCAAVLQLQPCPFCRYDPHAATRRITATFLHTIRPVVRTVIYRPNPSHD